ncbi:MAG: hypothetical protein U9Q82_04885 [Chloroflexota bacterium]|nr:hypothetical protein [Chloroflexota bacterium]
MGTLFAIIIILIIAAITLTPVANPIKSIRYCQQCDLLVAHKHEIEHLLYNLFSQYEPKAIGNDYLIIGTMEKKCWREGLKKPKDIAEMLPHASGFKSHYQELRLSQPGWYPKDQEPAIMEPHPHQEWVKGDSRNNV